VITLLIASAWAEPISGTVRERGSGDPIADVQVTAGEAVTTTGADGGFALDVPADLASVRFEHADYVPQTVEIGPPREGVELGAEPLTVWLEALPPPMEVVVEAFALTPHVSRHRVDAEQAFETPGTLDDAVRLVQALPSVTIQREYGPNAGALMVRGAGPADSRYLLDGIELPYLYHYNQYSSVFPSSQLDSLDLYPSTFGAAFGDAVGATVDARSKTEAPKALHGTVTANFLMAGGDVSAPLGGGWWGSASGRRSYLDLAGEGSAQYTLWPIFHDYSARAQRDRGDGSLALFAFGAGDRWDRAAGELDLLDPVEQDATASFRYRRGYDAVGAVSRWDGATDGRIVGALLWDRLSGELSTGPREDLDTIRATSRLDVEGSKWAAGWEILADRTRLVVEGSGPETIVVAEEAPALARRVDAEDVIYRLRAAAYGELRWKAGPIRVYPGLRLPADSSGGLLWPEPRLSARWQVADQTAVALATGLYQQTADTDLLVAAPDLGPTRSLQVAAKLEQTVAGRLEFQLEAYRKWNRDVLLSPPGELPYAEPRGEAQGVELVSRYRIRERFFLWGWASVAKSTAGGVPTDGDQRVAGGVVASWDPDEAWNVSVRWRYGSGLPYTPVVGSIYDGTDDSWIPVPGEVNGARLPSYQKLDVHVGRTWTFRSWSLLLAAELGYVPAGSAQLYPTWSHDWSEQGWVVGPTLLPLLSGRARF
jgi:hypothetical protein